MSRHRWAAAVPVLVCLIVVGLLRAVAGWGGPDAQVIGPGADGWARGQRLDVRIERAELTQSVAGQGYGDKKTHATTGWFVVVFYTEIAHREAAVLDDVALITSDGREYADLRLDTGSGYPAPGEQLTGAIVFEIPQGAEKGAVIVFQRFPRSAGIVPYRQEIHLPLPAAEQTEQVMLPKTVIGPAQ